jgi:AbrB family looped-hinge helix DNA binding protein
MSKTVTMNKKGQIEIPAEMRASLNLESRDVLLLRQEGQAIILERRRDVLDSLAGKYATPGRSLADELHQERRAERQ